MANAWVTSQAEISLAQACVLGRPLWIRACFISTIRNERDGGLPRKQFRCWQGGLFSPYGRSTQPSLPAIAIGDPPSPGETEDGDYSGSGQPAPEVHSHAYSVLRGMDAAYVLVMNLLLRTCNILIYADATLVLHKYLDTYVWIRCQGKRGHT